jgi:hypothetical protein
MPSVLVAWAADASGPLTTATALGVRAPAVGHVLAPATAEAVDAARALTASTATAEVATGTVRAGAGSA